MTSAPVASAGASDSDPGRRGIMPVNIEQDANLRLPRPLFQVTSKGRCSLARLSGRASFCDYSEST